MPDTAPAKTADKRTADQIRADLAANRARVAAGVQELIEEVKPSAVRARVAEEAKSFARAEVHAATSGFTQGIKDEDGNWRRDRLVLVGGALVGTLVFLATVRAIVCHFSDDE